jgi:glycosyltransferase involved in cell wall biosynthesis
MASVYWSIREKIRLNPVVSRSIYIAQSSLKVFSKSEFSEKVKQAARNHVSAEGVALCVRIRDEAPDLREFVEYYLAAGVKHLFFYEARSVDNFREVLESFIAAGQVTLISDWPYIPISPAAEHDCALRCIGHYSWMGCIDADEFVVIQDGRSIPEFLAQVPAQHPAVALHWRMYGSNGHIKRPDLPVIVAYTRRQIEPNLHVKVFVRPQQVRLQRNSHSWYYRGLLSAAVNEKNKKVWGSTAVPATAERVWINHYYYKSQEEFERKARRTSILDRVGIQFNSRTPQRGAEFERTANEVLDLAAVDYHRRLCKLAGCSICAAIARASSAQSSEPISTSASNDVNGSHSYLREAPIRTSELSSSKPFIVDRSVSVVICTRFRPAALENCLRAIAALNGKPDELIIVDNSSGDKLTEDLARKFSAVYLVEPEMGLSRARNLGLAECKSEIIAYLDDDALPEEHWLEHIIEPFADPRVAVVTGEAITPESVVGKNGPKPPSSLDKKERRWFEIAAFGRLGIGTNMALRKSACTLPEMFDERLGRGAPFHGMEEHHAFAQLLSHDYCAVHIPAAVVYHSSQNPMNVKREACNNVAYSLLLFAEFPERRLDLLRFLLGRLFHRPLTWMRDAPDPGEVISSNWRVLLRASVSGTLLYVRTRKAKK